MASVNQVVPLYCFEPRLFGSTPRGYPKTGPFRTQFLLQSVAALRASLRGIGSDLLTTDSAPQQAVSGAPVATLRHIVVGKSQCTSQCMAAGKCECSTCMVHCIINAHVTPSGCVIFTRRIQA